MGSRLPSHGFADRAMAGVIVDRIVIGIRMDVVAATSEFMRHLFSPSSIKGVILNVPAHSARLPSMERTIGEKRELARVIFLSAVEADHLGRQKYLPTAADSLRPQGLSLASLDHDGEVLESYVTKRRDRKAALKFLKKSMKRYGRPKGFCQTVLLDMCNGRNVPLSHLSFRPDERHSQAMSRSFLQSAVKLWAQCGLVHQKKEPLGGKNEEILRWCSCVHPRWCAGVRTIKPRKARRNGRQTSHLKPVRNADLPTNKNKLYSNA